MQCRTCSISQTHYLPAYSGASIQALVLLAAPNPVQVVATSTRLTESWLSGTERSLWGPSLLSLLRVASIVTTRSCIGLRQPCIGWLDCA